MEAGVVEFLQGIKHPFLDVLFTGITYLADKWFFLLIFCAVYWCFDKKTGYALGVVLLFSSGINSVIKEHFKELRPFQTMEISTIVENTAKGYSFPSGHSQSASAFYTFLTLAHSKKWIGFSIAATLLVAVSRVYAGVHWPRDVIYGIVIGMAAAGILAVIYRFARPAIVGLFACAALLAVLLSPLEANSEFIYAFSALCGITLGFAFEILFVDFGPARTLGAAAGRLGFGIIVTAAAYVTLYYFFSSIPFICYGAAGFTATGLIPLAFEKSIKKY